LLVAKLIDFINISCYSSVNLISCYLIKNMTTWEINFIKKYRYSMGERYSKFRGTGTITVDGDTLTVKGKRIDRPTILGTILILSIVVALTLIFKINFWILFAVFTFFDLIHFIVLKKENLTLTWSQISKYELEDQGEMISFSIENNSKCSPVIFVTENFAELAAQFREKIRERERTSHGWTALEQRSDEQMNSMGKAVDRWFEGKRR